MLARGAYAFANGRGGRGRTGLSATIATRPKGTISVQAPDVLLNAEPVRRNGKPADPRAGRGEDRVGESGSHGGVGNLAEASRRFHARHDVNVDGRDFAIPE